MSGDLIRRQDAIDAALTFLVEYCGAAFDEDMQKMLCERLDALPSADTERTVKVVDKWKVAGYDELNAWCPECEHRITRGCSYCPTCEVKLDWSE